MRASPVNCGTPVAEALSQSSAALGVASSFVHGCGLGTAASLILQRTVRDVQHSTPHHQY